MSLSFSYSRQAVPPPLPPSATGALSTADLEAMASALEQPSTLNRFVTRQLQIESSARELSRAASVVPPQREEVPSGSASSGSTSAYSSSASTQVRHPAYATLRSRLITFTNWPHTHKSNYPSATPITLALEGFFSPPDPQSRLSSHADEVICYACGGHLSNWEPTDVPAAEHHTHQKGRCALLRLRAASKVQPSTVAIVKGVAKKYNLKPSSAASGTSSSRDYSYIPSSSTTLLSGVENLIGRHHYRLPSSSSSSNNSSAEQREREKYVKALARRYRGSDHTGSSGDGTSSSSMPALGSSEEEGDEEYLDENNNHSDAGGGDSTPPALVSPPAAVFKTHDPLYLPIPPEQIQAAVYVTPVTSSADARASANNNNNAASTDWWSDPDSAYASSSMRERRERALASREGGVYSSSTHETKFSYPLSAFERIRHRHLKRCRSLWSMEMYGQRGSGSGDNGSVEMNSQHLPPVAPDSVYAREEASNKYRRTAVDQESALKQAKEKVRELRQAGISISSANALSASSSASLERDIQSHTERLRSAQKAVQALEEELRNRFASSASSSLPSASSSNHRRAIRLSVLANGGTGASTASPSTTTEVAEEVLRERLGFAKDRMARMRRTVQAELDAQLKALDKKEGGDASIGTHSTLDPLALMQTIWLQEAATAVMLGQ